MKKLLLSAVLVASLGAVTVANAATGGTITINGQVSSSTCNVTIGGSASPTITLPTMIDVMLPQGTSGGWTAFTMSLSGCTTIGSYTKVFPYFTGTQIDAANGYLKNATVGGSNVEVVLSNAQNTTNALTLQNGSGNQNAGSASLSAGTATFNYYAGYIAPAGAGATAGGVNTTVQYALNYQ